MSEKGREIERNKERACVCVSVRERCVSERGQCRYFREAKGAVARDSQAPPTLSVCTETERERATERERESEIQIYTYIYIYIYTSTYIIYIYVNIYM